jgi:electron transport complex protein RnfB
LAAPLVSADAIDALLPQTQCTRCGYAGCLPYATAIATGEADTDQCPPGGEVTARALAQLLGRAYKPIHPRYGSEGPPRVAVIDERICIGCAKCLPPCPVDAIIGARKHLHTVIAADCSGCELCLPACPVDCITMRETSSVPLSREALSQRQAQYRSRYQAHQQRQTKRLQDRHQRLARHSPSTS